MPLSSSRTERRIPRPPNVRFWHIASFAAPEEFGRFPGQNGHRECIASFSASQLGIPLRSKLDGLFAILIAKRLNDMFDVSAPAIQRLLAFGKEFVPLVNGRHTGNRPLLMV